MDKQIETLVASIREATYKLAVNDFLKSILDYQKEHPGVKEIDILYLVKTAERLHRQASKVK